MLDLWDTGQNFWSMCSGASTHGCLSSQMAPTAKHRSMTKQLLAPLRLFIDLCLKKRTLDNFLTYLIKWVEQRKVSIHLGCKELKIVSMPIENIMKILSMMQLDYIQEMEVNCIWHLSTLAMFAPSWVR